MNPLLEAEIAKTLAVLSGGDRVEETASLADRRARVEPLWIWDVANEAEIAARSAETVAQWRSGTLPEVSDERPLTAAQRQARWEAEQAKGRGT